MDEIVQLIKGPQDTLKSSAAWFIGSNYNAFDARSSERQVEDGSFGMLIVDIDTGQLSLEDVVARIKRVIGDASFWVHSTKSATEEDPKWRILIPLAVPIPGTLYALYQLALFKALEAVGIPCDHAMKKPSQIVYLPNKGEFYQFHIQDGERMNASLVLALEGAKPKQGISLTDAMLRQTPASIDKLNEIRGYIPVPDDYSEWLHLVMAIHDATNGSQEGLELAEEWSSGGSKYKPGEVAKKWGSF